MVEQIERGQRLRCQRVVWWKRPGLADDTEHDAVGCVVSHTDIVVNVEPIEPLLQPREGRERQVRIQ
ncbi:MAG TPA: hypothetical protein VKV73_04370 [Chloroflexota bacterium]|nr:hypothetical protein [Chloroflexota bacterium]